MFTEVGATVSEGASPAEGVGFLAPPSYHEVKTEHIMALINEAQELAVICNGAVADGQPIEVRGQTTLVHMALDRAANCLRHAAEELQDERFLALGWPRV